MADLGGGVRTSSRLGQNSYIFMQFSTQIGQLVLAPPPSEVGSPLFWEFLDPPLFTH